MVNTVQHKLIPLEFDGLEFFPLLLLTDFHCAQIWCQCSLFMVLQKSVCSTTS